jgi:hypothetical protein
MGEWIDFRNSGNAAPYLWLGWSASEAWGRGASGTRASLLMRLAPAEAVALDLDAKLRAYVTTQHPAVTVTVLANNREVGRWRFDGGQPETRHVMIPAAVVASSPVLHLRFVIDSPASPAALGISADDRLLGIGMEALRVVGTGDPTQRDP